MASSLSFLYRRQSGFCSWEFASSIFTLLTFILPSCSQNLSHRYLISIQEFRVSLLRSLFYHRTGKLWNAPVLFRLPHLSAISLLKSRINKLILTGMFLKIPFYRQSTIRSIPSDANHSGIKDSLKL